MRALRSRWWGVRAGGAVLAFAVAIFIGAITPGAALAVSPQALILGSTVTGGTSSLEAQGATNDGFAVTVVSDAQWDAMTAADFAKYQVLIIGDPTCGDTTDGAAATNKSVWQGVVMASGGNRVIIGTDPTYHNGEDTGGGHTAKGAELEQNGIAFAGAVSGATGAYVDISCESVFLDTPDYPFLDGLSTHNSPGAFQAQGPPCEGNIAIVAQSGPTSGLHDADLSNWSCSVHQSFSAWPSDFTPLAIATDAPSTPYCANDVDTGTLACGQPYILLAGGGVTITSNITLTPASATNPVGGSHTVTAKIVDSTGNPVAGKTVTFSIDSGPNVGKTGTGVTNASGETTFTYTDTGGAGTDSISAVFTTDAGAQEKATATKMWVTSTGDTTPPSCVLSSKSSTQIQVTLQDTGSGLNSVSTTTSNATASVGSFSSGTTSPVVVTATKTDTSKSASLAIKASDVSGNIVKCDPVWGAKAKG